ncbi:MAG: hypothetical protein ACHP7N_05980 [Caulobacterales bacterium]
MNFRLVVVAALGVALAGCHQGKPSTLTGKLTADNAFYAYLSTSPTERGELIGSGDAWGTTFDLKPSALAPGATYYLNIEAINYGDQGAAIGEFHLSGDEFHFANGAQTLLTGAAGWTGGYGSPNGTVAPQPWVPATGAVFSQGANGVGPWGKVTGVDPSAQWIWPSDPQSAQGSPQGACGTCTVVLSARIVAAG